MNGGRRKAHGGGDGGLLREREKREREKRERRKKESRGLNFPRVTPIGSA
jgi:hypothetical protein